MNQAELRTLAEERLKDAKVLLRGKRWASAYYMAGYAVECGLKSCELARMVYTGWVFQEKANPKECQTHDFWALIKLAGLEQEIRAELDANDEFSGRWGVTIDWKSSVRYETIPKADAVAMIEAIADDNNGVLAWIRKYW